jgi:predicted nucleotidyltransferase
MAAITAERFRVEKMSGIGVSRSRTGLAWSNLTGRAGHDLSLRRHLLLSGFTLLLLGIHLPLPANDSQMNKLALLFHSAVRAEMLRLLFGARQREMYRAEIIGHTPFAQRSVEEELQKLVDLELITTVKDGNRRYYAANHAHPLYSELHAIVLKTSGLKDLLVEALPKKKIAFAFVFGSVAATEERAESDVDLMIVGSASHRELASTLRVLGERIGREINPHFFDTAELTRRLAANDHFLSDVIAKPKLFIIGDENEFTHLVGRRLAPAP